MSRKFSIDINSVKIVNGNPKNIYPFSPGTFLGKTPGQAAKKAFTQICRCLEFTEPFTATYDIIEEIKLTRKSYVGTIDPREKKSISRTGDIPKKEQETLDLKKIFDMLIFYKLFQENNYTYKDPDVHGFTKQEMLDTTEKYKLVEVKLAQQIQKKKQKNIKEVLNLERSDIFSYTFEMDVIDSENIQDRIKYFILQKNLNHDTRGIVKVETYKPLKSV